MTKSKKRGTRNKPGKAKKRWARAWRILLALTLIGAGIWWWSDRSSPDVRDQTQLERLSLREIRRRAERGDGPAQMELAERYCRGTGVKKNVFECAEWHRKAANSGFGVAMLRLGDLYATGEGFILDKSAAVMWWRRAESTADGAAGATRRLRETNAGAGSQY